MQTITQSHEAGIPNPVQFWDMTNPSGPASVQAWNDMDSDTLYGIATHKFDKHATPQDRFSLMITIASMLRLRHVRYEDVIAIDKSIELGRTALLLTDSLDGNSKSRALGDLGYSIYWRAVSYHDPEDLAESINLLESAFRTKDNQDKDAAYIVYLATALIKNFQISHDMAAIDRAIHCLRIALEADEAKNDSDFSPKNLLAISLSLRFDISKNEKDLRDAISLLREAADLPDTDQLKCTSLTNLGLLLKKLHSHSFDDDKAGVDDEFIDLMRRAVELTPDGFPNKVDMMFNLAQSLRQRGHPGDIQEALTQSSAAARSRFGSIWSLFDAAEEWRRDALECGISPLEAFGRSLELLPRMAWHGLPISQRHLRLVQWSHLTCDAAAVAVEEEQYNLAVEWLEQGRSIVWGQLIQLRSPLETLRLKKPEQAQRLAQLSRYLEEMSAGNIQTLGMDDISNEDLSHRQHSCADKFDKLLENVREDPEFEDFLRPPKFSKLVEVNKNGPVVLLNVSGDRCDALALVPGMDDEVMHIPLQNVSRERTLVLHDILRDCLSTSSIRTQHDRISRIVCPSGRDDRFIGLLSELWTCVVEPVLGSLSLLVSPFLLI
jgi:tetratricopeptide (TPR) repeat protein